MAKRIMDKDFNPGRIFFVPFMDSDYGAFGYIKYQASTRKNPYSFEFSLSDIYDRVCKFDEWSDNIKNEKIKISDMIINAGYFGKTEFNTKPWILTDHYTNIIHPVIYGFFKTGLSGFEKTRWYDADAKNIKYPHDINQYREIKISFPPYNSQYIEAVLKGFDIEYGEPIPDFKS